MECQRTLCLTEGHNLLSGFGRGCMKPWIPNYVTPYFLKKIGFYKFIYLNKYLFVAFHARCMFFFVFWSVFIFYCVSRSHRNSNLNWIQISLQIINIFEKEKEFPSSSLATGRNPTGTWVQPIWPLLSPPPFSIFHVAQPSQPSLASLWSRPGRASPGLTHAWPRSGPALTIAYLTPSHHWDGDAVGQNLNGIDVKS
jgi:hypothetical protein